MSEYSHGLVSVIIPVYNRERLVSKTIDSILNQTYSWVEVIVINDGSTDNSLSVLQSYANRNPERVKVVDQANTGQVRARNNGLVKARGEYIAFLDSDDTWEREKLALQIPLFQENVGLVYCGIHEVDTNGNIIKTVLCEADMRGDIYKHLLIKNRMTGGTVVVTRAALDKVGQFDESFRAAENWDLWIRISKEFKVDYVNQPLVNYLKHQGNMSGDNYRMIDASWALLRKHLPQESASGPFKDVYKTAYANHYYNLGLSCFVKADYTQSRKYFFMACKMRLFYKDTAVLIARTLLGRRINKVLSLFKQKKANLLLYQLI